jgi:hypothetical protein
MTSKSVSFAEGKTRRIIDHSACKKRKTGAHFRRNQRTSGECRSRREAYGLALGA